MSCIKKDSCKLGCSVKNVNMPYLGSSKPKILIVKDFPESICDTTGYLFQEQNNSILFSAIQSAGLSYDDVRLTSLVKCASDRNNKPGQDIINLCTETNLNNELLNLKGLEIIIPLGSITKDFFLPGEKGITVIAGQVFNKDYGFGTVKVIPNFTTNYLSVNPGETNKFNEIFIKVKNLLSEKESVFKKKSLSPKEFYDYFRRLLKYKEEGKIEDVVYDIETSNAYDGMDLLHHMFKDEYITGFSLADKVEKVGYYITIYHPDTEKMYGREIAGQRAAFTMSTLKLLLETIPVTCHNAKFDLNWSSYKLGIPIDKITLKDDTLLMAYLVIGSDRMRSFGLKNLAKFYLNINEEWDESIEAEISKFKQIWQRRLINIPLPILENYGSIDAVATLYLQEMFHSRLKEDNLNEIYRTMLKASIEFSRIERAGTAVDVPLINWLNDQYHLIKQNCEEELNNLPIVLQWRSYNKNRLLVSGGNDMKEFMFSGLWLGAKPRSISQKTKQPSLDSDTKLDLYRNGESELIKDIAKRVIIIDEIKSQISKYVNPVLTQVETLGGFYPSYNIIGTATGRLSSMFHGMPSFGDFKSVFVSRWRNEGGLIMAPDYSQLEVRVIAAFSKDEGLKKAYEDGLDIHRYVASRIYNKEFDKVTKGERSYGKAVVFGIVYGESVHTLAKKLGLSVEEAQAIQDLLFKAFPGLQIWIASTTEFLKKNGYTTSAFGRRRYLTDATLLNDSKQNERKIADAVRGGVNHPIQSTGSDVNLTTLLSLNKYFRDNNLQTIIEGCVHDSLEIDVHPSEIIQVYRSIKEIGESRIASYDWTNGVPFQIDIDLGANWKFAMSSEIIESSENRLILKLKGRELGLDWFKRVCENNKYHKFIFSDEKITPWNIDDDDKDRLFSGCLDMLGNASVKLEIIKL